MIRANRFGRIGLRIARATKGDSPRQTKPKKAVHELFAGAFRNKGSMWIVLVFPRKNTRIHKNGPNSWASRFDLFFGLPGQLLKAEHLHFPNAVVLNAVRRRRTQMRAKERKMQMSANAKERKRARKGAKECKRSLPRKSCKQPGWKKTRARNLFSLNFRQYFGCGLDLARIWLGYGSGMAQMRLGRFRMR